MVQLVTHVEENEWMSVDLLKDQVVENYAGKNQEHHTEKMAWTESCL